MSGESPLFGAPVANRLLETALFATKELVLCQANLQFETLGCAETGTLSGAPFWLHPHPVMLLPA